MTEPATRPQIRDRLTAFVARWSQRSGDEKSEAQTFLNQLLDCYSDEWRDDPNIRFEHHYQGGGFADLLWKGVALVEMKSKAETDRLVEHHWRQAFAYWDRSGFPDQEIGAPRYLVLCSFDRFVIWEPGEFPVPADARPGPVRVDLRLEDLPERVEALDFLRGKVADFDANSVDLAKEAVGAVTRLFVSLAERGVDSEIARDFTLQATWCCFAEDLDMFPEQLLTQAVERLRSDPGASSYDILGELFEWLNRAGDRPSGGAFKGAPYVNGGLFEHPARVELEPAEIELLLTATRADWHKVEPSVFGGLFTGTLADERRRVAGAHYTPEAEIQKIVQPTIVRPWRRRIAGVADAGEAVALLEELAAFRVLDPACGSGNFLYVAYQELRTLEQALKGEIARLFSETGRTAPSDLPRVSLSNMLGIEKDPFAARLAQVVLWIGHKIAVDKHGLAEDVLPLADLSGIVCADALHAEWPECDAIIGNPPFIGDRQLRGAVGDDYIEWLTKTFEIGVKDYCVYWFRKAHAHLRPGERAGLVGTNSVSQNRGRSESLGFVAANGGVITDAVSTQPWPGEANVHVSIVNWVKEPAQPVELFVLDGHEVAGGISPSLRSRSESVDTAMKLQGNEGRAFIGPVINGGGFIIEAAKARELLAKRHDWREVIRPYLVGDDIVTRPDQSPSRWVIDFGFRTLDEAAEYPEALEIVRRLVKPHRDQVRRATYRENWWRFAEPIRRMRQAIAPLYRYITSPAQGKRFLLSWQDPWTCPSNLTIVFAFDDDYSMGILSSAIHERWARAQSSTLEDRLRYTPSTVFSTFPWPDPSDDGRREIGAISARLIEERDRLCVQGDVGLTRLYNEADEGAHGSLRALHDELDKAVAAAYGWPGSVLGDPNAITGRLLALNAEMVAAGDDYAPFPPLAAPEPPQGERLFVPDDEIV